MLTQTAAKPRITVDTTEDDISVVNFVDRRLVDTDNIETMGKNLFRLVNELGRRRILLDFSDVIFLNSQALDTINAFHRHLSTVGGQLALCSVNDSLMPTFNGSNVRIFADQAAALTHLKAAGRTGEGVVGADGGEGTSPPVVTEPTGFTGPGQKNTAVST